MNIKGKRVRRTRWFHTPGCVVQVEVEAVTPADDPSEPCYEPETVEFLKQVHEQAEAGDFDWLRKIGKVFTPLPAA